MDLGDVRVIQRGERLGFAREADVAVRVMRERLGQDFDGHVAIELGVARAEDLAHAAFAKQRGDLVDAKTRAGGEGQGLRDYTDPDGRSGPLDAPVLLKLPGAFVLLPI